MYKQRYYRQQYQYAYENACDCHYFGIGPSGWNDCNIPKEKRAEIWKLAYWDMAEPDIEHGEMMGEVYIFDKHYA